MPQFFCFSWWLFLLPGEQVGVCLHPNTGIASLAEDCLVVELSRSLDKGLWFLCSPVNAFRPNSLWPVTVVEVPSKPSPLALHGPMISSGGLEGAQPDKTEN